MASKWFYVLLAFLGGICVSPQGAINAILGRFIGNIQAAIVSFAVGLGSLIVVSLAFYFSYPGNWTRIIQAPKYTLCGGFLGAIIVFTALLAVPKIGATPTVMAILIGQIISSIIIDHYGWFEVPVMTYDPLRLVGLVLLVVSLPLVLR